MKNKQIYESIMKSLSESVHKAIFESDVDDQTYCARDFFFQIVECDYNNGQIGQSQTWSQSSIKLYESDIMELIQSVLKYFSLDIDNGTYVMVFNDEIFIQVKSDEYGNELDRNELKSWERGDIKGYDYDIRFNIYNNEGEQILHDELVAAGIDSYD